MKLIWFAIGSSLVRLHDESRHDGKGSLSIDRCDVRLIQSVLLVDDESESVRQPAKLLQFRYLFRRFGDDSQDESDSSPLFVAYRRLAGTHSLNMSFQRNLLATSFQAKRKEVYLSLYLNGRGRLGMMRLMLHAHFSKRNAMRSFHVKRLAAYRSSRASAS